jgi:D-glycero-alpha-D-manno-heptose-7-phosphate kinase
MDRGLEIHHDGDLPARSGMGSSSAFTVGFLHAIHALNGHMADKRQLATESIFLEQEVLRETVGSQDQVQAAFGGFNVVTFHSNDEISVRPVTVSRSRLGELNAHLMLFYTGIKRTASNIADTFVHAIDDRKRQLRIMKDLVDESVTILNSESDLTAFGELLHEAWQTKRSLSPSITNPVVDGLYDRAIRAGAIGGKLTGAGGGGFLLLFAPPDRQAAIRDELHDFIRVPFRFEFSGSQIIFCDREEEYVAEERYRAAQSIRAFEELKL